MSTSTPTDITLLNQTKKSNTGLIVGLTIGGVILIIIISVVLYFLLRKKKCTTNSDCSNTEICSNGKCIPNPNPPPQPIPTPTACTSNGDCAPGNICQSGRCIPGAQCTNNSDCPTGQFCIAGGCVPPASICQKDNDCSKGTFCCNGTCQTCCITANCPHNNTCINHTCVPNAQCSTTADCTKNGEGGICNNGQCTCANNSDCSNIGVTGAICKNGRCMVNCVNNADCPPNTACSQGQCVPIIPSQPCSPSNPGGTCPNPGDQCVNGICLTVCTSGSTCPTGMRCASGYCVVGCQHNNDCSPGKVCSAGNCVTSALPSGSYIVQYQPTTSNPNYLTAYYDPAKNNAYMSLTQTKDTFGNSVWQYTANGGFFMTNFGTFGTDTSNPPIPINVDSNNPSASGWSLTKDGGGQIQYSQDAFPCLNYTNSHFIMGQCDTSTATGWTFTSP